MSISEVSAGDKVPHEFNVIIEIPMNADPVKYEIDKATGALFRGSIHDDGHALPRQLRVCSPDHRRR